ncbi:MAG: hypothetical protein NTZ83_01625 [Candidatus Pacearchaeota archaeon]|nr:hypothetical protein [Candidatus Pacearchaeota archaeon]
MGDHKRIELTKQDHFYYLLVFDEYSDLSVPHLQMPFPYHTSQDKPVALEKARGVGKDMAEKRNLPLEEKI